MALARASVEIENPESVATAVLNHVFEGTEDLMMPELTLPASAVVSEENTEEPAARVAALESDEIAVAVLDDVVTECDAVRSWSERRQVVGDFYQLVLQFRQAV